MQFAKGKPRPANSGRRKGSSNKGTERARRLISEKDDKEIVDKVVEAAKTGGDPHALGLYFRHLRPPPPRETYIGPVDYTAPKTVEEARAALLELGERLARREIPVELHDSLVNGIKAYLGDRAAEQERLLARLEETSRQSES